MLWLTTERATTLRSREDGGSGLVTQGSLRRLAIAILAAFCQSGQGLDADIDLDGVVNFADLNEVLANIGVDCPE